MNKVVTACFFAVMYAAVFTKPAYAYLDPGTGSLLLQGLIAGVAAVGAAGSMYYQQIKAKFKRMYSKKAAEDISAVSDD